MRNAFAISAIFIFIWSSHASADLVFSHSGNIDPTTEGWTPSITGGNSVGPITNDLGTGIHAWFTDDNNTTGSNFAAYSATPNSSQVSAGNLHGWILSTRLRVVDVPDNTDAAVVTLYRDGVTSWQMHFGSEADGDPIVELRTLSGGPRYTIQNSGGGYHQFDLKYDPSSLSADLFVDGIEVINGYTGFAFGTTEVAWGAGSSADTGQGNFASVSFSTVPEPTSLVLMILAAVPLAIARRQQRS